MWVWVRVWGGGGGVCVPEVEGGGRRGESVVVGRGGCEGGWGEGVC